MSVPPVLGAEGLGVGIGGRASVAGLSFAVHPGEFVAVLGRNGAGKTLLLHTLAGLRPAWAGTVRLGGRDLRALRRREVAASVALLPQDLEPVPDTTAREVVAAARYARRPAWRGPDAADEDIADDALQRAGAGALAARAFDQLSGGERRRVATAAVLAQGAPLLLLDEPTNHLDPHHALASLALFAAHCTAGGSVIASLHDPTLAARHATHVLMLHGEGRWEFGPAAQLLEPDRLSALYLTGILEARVAGRRVFVPA
jgi:iron complex transport system ATP-binding protein